jgi:hypothetical protein
MSESILALALASFGVVWLLHRTSGPWLLFGRLLAWAERGESVVADLYACPYCLGAWVTGGLWLVFGHSMVYDGGWVIVMSAYGAFVLFWQYGNK